MSTNDEAGALRQAVNSWHESLLSNPATQTLLSHAHAENGSASTGAGAPSASDRSAAVSVATEALVASLEDKQLPDGLIDDILSVVDVFTALCGLAGPSPSDSFGAGASSGRSGTPLNPAKLKLLKAATGLPVHTTSIGRRASASYCVYESMGGWETLSAAVESLYNRMRNDGRCASLFGEGNEQQLKTHMLEFLTCALGGKARFASSTLLTSQRDQLRQHGFGVGQFDIMLQHMKAVLDEIGVQQETAASAIALLRCHKYLFERRQSESDHSDLPTGPVASPAGGGVAAAAVEAEEEAGTAL
ncbi:hypothetical protein HYH02_003075 [Chlamydomonas schloesseri]|uniref:Uncharacterized protein n=1 Tax=Chlamydomonas schloesseri TaxID=2026947 RepID=A0A835WQH5_9CHLO|nr:hypothetical protein HYH02_003075 [Chlamydomonas schloesseri]|eukprot:KAG2452037.1 hypothetical protein HYH02_003075 [Chlamydomonas schloesseri]